MLYHVIPCYIPRKTISNSIVFHCIEPHFAHPWPPPNPIPDGDMMSAPGEDDSIHVAKKKAAEDLANKMQEKQKKKEADE